MITPRTTGIIGVHVWGRPCDVDALQSIADRHNLTLMFDAAHAFGCSHKGRMIGGFGLAEVFSFHATKFLNTFEGGAVVTNDDGLAERMRLMQNFGFRGYDNVIYLGTNGKMDEVSAAMGLVGLESIDEFVARNRANYELYRERLGRLTGISLLEYDHREKNNYQYVVAEIDERACGLSRDELVAVLRAENVLVRKYFWPGCHNMMPYLALFPHARLLLPATEKMAQRVIVFPTGMSMGEPEITLVADIVRTAIERAGEITQAVRAQNSVAPALAS